MWFHWSPTFNNSACHLGQALEIMESVTLVNLIAYKKPLILVFMDYKKEFEYIKNNEMCRSLTLCRIDSRPVVTLSIASHR